jgi:hypothetical protein
VGTRRLGRQLGKDSGDKAAGTGRAERRIGKVQSNQEIESSTARIRQRGQDK